MISSISSLENDKHFLSHIQIIFYFIMAKQPWYKLRLGFWLGLSVILLLATPLYAQNNNDIIEDIVIRGTQRTDGLSLLSYLPLGIGDTFSQDLMDKALKTLYTTGNFSDIRITRENNDLVITISEQPIINEIVFEGNNIIETKILETEMRTRPRQIYNEARIQSDVRNMINLYQRYGRFAIRIEPKIIRLEQNRINLVLEISEGRKTSIDHIAFIGNRFFTDSRLHDEIYSRERAFLRFFGTNFDPERLEGDRQGLRDFYRNHGFPDIEITSAIAELSRAQQYFLVNFSLNEGNRFKIGEIKLTSDVAKLEANAAKLQKVLKKSPLESGDWYHFNRIDDIQLNLITAANNLSFPFVDVVIEEIRNLEDSTIDIHFKLIRAPKIYIERIEIIGNTRTLDNVIRRKLLFTEGDALIQSKINRAQRDLQFTGFFKHVQLSTLPGSKASNIILQIAVKERLTGTLNFGLGYGSLNGASLKFGIQEQNFGGRGNKIGASLEVNSNNNNLAFSNSKPFYRGLPLTLDYQLFRNQSALPTLPYNVTNQGISANINYQIGSSFWRHSFGYSATQNIFGKIQNVDFDRDNNPNTIMLEPAIPKLFRQTLTFALTQSFSRDTRNKRFGPSKGSNFSIYQSYAGIGGDDHYVQTILNYAIYHSLTRNSTIDFRMRGITINETEGRLNSTHGRFTGGQYLRGFVYGGVGPISSTGLHVPVTDILTTSIETFFPVGLPPETNIVGTVFLDNGIVTNTDYEHNYSGLQDTGSIRGSWGYGLVWRSPIGIIKFEWYRPYVYEEYDQLDLYEFSIGASF